MLGLLVPSNLEGETSPRVSGHLISDPYGHVVLLGDLLQARQHLREFLLALSKLATAAEVNAEQRHDRVDNLRTQNCVIYADIR